MKTNTVSFSRTDNSSSGGTERLCYSPTRIHVPVQSVCLSEPDRRETKDIIGYPKNTRNQSTGKPW